MNKREIKKAVLEIIAFDLLHDIEYWTPSVKGRLTPGHRRRDPDPEVTEKEIVQVAKVMEELSDEFLSRCRNIK